MVSGAHFLNTLYPNGTYSLYEILRFTFRVVMHVTVDEIVKILSIL
jgi:hypothetical protein